MSTFLDDEKPFLLTLPLNEVWGRVVVAPLDKCGGDCHLAAYFIRHRENNESIAWRRRTTIGSQKYKRNS
jgi:hypothetical protein